MNNSIQRLSAIRVKTLAPTNTKGKRFSVSVNGVRKVYSYDHGLKYEENVVEAARKFAIEMEWENSFFIGVEIPSSVHNFDCHLFTQVSKNLTSDASHRGVREIAAFETDTIQRA